MFSEQGIVNEVYNDMKPRDQEVVQFKVRLTQHNLGFVNFLWAWQEYIESWGSSYCVQNIPAYNRKTQIFF